MQTQQSVLIAHYSRTKIAIVQLFALSYLAVGVGMIIGSRADIVMAAFGFLIVLIWARIFWFGARAFCDRREILRIGPEGIFDRRILEKTLPWYAIANAQEMRYLLFSIFVFALNEPISNYRMRNKRWRDVLFRLDNRGDFRIGTGDFDVSRVQIRNVLREHWRNWM